ncbi:hemocyanin 1-like isoform X1 [Rhopilema esculentum]|uniref:hemocyanin 1-like isoform X1 n=2 Tax=Rhopilema esculentum TaxID=499914 RepID=UPI0031DB3CEB
MPCKSLVLLLHFTAMLSEINGRQNFGIVIDTSENMGRENFKQSIVFIERLAQHISISLGTIRISVSTVGNSFIKHLGVTESINREHFLDNLKKLSCCNGVSQAKTMLKAIQVLDNDEFNDRKMNVLLLFLGEKCFKEWANMKFAGHQSNKNILVFTSSYDRYFTKCLANNVTCLNINSFDSSKTALQALNLPGDIITQCNVTGKIFDECGRHCDCVNGTITNCYRIRKEFTQMTKRERRKYLKAYFKLTTKFPFKYRYEKFIYIHQKYFCYGIHSKRLFLPWHRFYILQMENLLREIDCSVTLPYWDWSFVGNDPWQSEGIWSEGSYGLGGNGSETNGFCVSSGMFQHPKWKTPYFNDNLDIVLSTIDIYGDLEEDEVLPNLSDCLRRYFDGHLPDSLHVQRALGLPPENFTDFDLNLRVNYHDTIHNAVGGTMCTHYAGTAPEFFLHHAFLDKIWFMWQQKSIEHKHVHFAKSRQKLVGFSHTAHELIDSHSLPGHVKVSYTKFPYPKKLKRDTASEGEYSDDVNTPTGAIFSGIVQTSSRHVFPSCKRKKSERLRAEYLDKIFSRRGY